MNYFHIKFISLRGAIAPLPTLRIRAWLSQYERGAQRRVRFAPMPPQIEEVSTSCRPIQGTQFHRATDPRSFEFKGENEASERLDGRLTYVIQFEKLDTAKTMSPRTLSSSNRCHLKFFQRFGGATKWQSVLHS